jgi:uncharacterized protein YndB with AHSA1/START domain
MNVAAAVTVPVDPDRAFAAFVDRIGSWWPEEIHVQHADTCDVLVEAHVGGRWLERTDAGAELDWGEVLAYDPPERLIVTWQLAPKPGWDPEADEDPGMHHDRDLRTELEVTFVFVSGEGTRVALEHRKLESLGDGPGPDAIRAMLAGGDVGWQYIIDHYARFTERT